MSVQFRSRTTAASTGNATLALPTGWQPNDIFLIVCETSGGENVPTPAGYTEITSSPQNTPQTRLTVFWKRAAVGETSVTIVDPGDHVIASLMAFSGVIPTGDPFHAVAGSNTGTTSSTSVSFEPITATIKDPFVIQIVAIGTDTNNDQFGSAASNLTDNNGNPISIIQSMTNVGDGGGFGVMMGLAVQDVESISTATISATSQQARISLVLTPDAAANADLLVPRVTLATVASVIADDAMSVSRSTLGVTALILDHDIMTIPRVNLSIVVDIDPPLTRRRGFHSFDP